MRLIKLLASLGLVATVGGCYAEAGAGGPRYAHRHHRHRDSRGMTVIVRDR